MLADAVLAPALPQKTDTGCATDSQPAASTFDQTAARIKISA
jgi:hypothetical protein